MRITNNMILSNTKGNINSNKLLVDKYNTQMTTQKKISKASEDPVIAIRSLRLSSKLSHINQYIGNNIPDAIAWMDVTETALTNMKDLLTDIRTHCVNGSTDTLNTEDRQTILEGLKALSQQVYAEGNADYAGKTVFTGYRSSSNLTFDREELDTKYQITQRLDFTNLEEKRFYTGNVKVPEAITADTVACDTKVEENIYERMRLAYNGNTELKNITFGKVNADGVFENDFGFCGCTDETTGRWDEVTGASNAPTLFVYDSEQAWEAADNAPYTGAKGEKTVGDNAVIYIKETGEFIFGKEVANRIADGELSCNVTYDKKGFDKGELRPEYYFDCKDITDDDATKHVVYTKQNQEIHYTVTNNSQITINTQADEVFDTDIARDVDELINVVQRSLSADEKVKQLQNMMTEDQYQDAASQETLKGYLDIATKEADYAADNLQKTFVQYIGRFDKYMETVNIAITNVGSMQNSLTLTKTRVENQHMTIEELKSDNEDRDISDIIIDYYASYNAYQSSLTAAGKLGQSKLLDYI